MSGSPPSVTIGIPTFRRPQLVVRAVRSALAQVHTNVEVLVADDASGDETVEVLGRIAADDQRLRVHRHDANVGHAANYRWTLEHATGEFFMWLSDDDHLDPGYVAACLAVHDRFPGTSLVTGNTVHTGAGRSFTEPPTELLSDRPGARVLAFYAGVDHNSGLFGVGRTSLLRRHRFDDVFGGDWSFVAGIAAAGVIRCAPDAVLHRSLEGLSSDARSLARQEFSLRGLTQRWPHVALAARIRHEIAAGNDSYSKLGPSWRRAALGRLARCLILTRFVVLALPVRVVGSFLHRGGVRSRRGCGE